MSGTESALPVDPEIEGAYADIGRALVAAAARQAQTRSRGKGGGPQKDRDSFEANVTLTITLSGGAEARGGVVCCVCTSDEWGVVTCKGPCCVYD